MSAPSRPQQLEREAFLAVVKAAMAKNAAGKPLAPKERNAWKRWELEEDERRGRRFIAAVPKKLYADWAGSQQKVLIEQENLFGIPLRGATVDVPAVIAWLHEFLRRYKFDLAPLVKGGPSGDRQPTLKEALLKEQVDLYRKKNELLEDQLAQRHRDLVPIAEVHKLHIQLATVLRGAGERLQKQFGDGAASILAVALDDFDAILDQLSARSDDAPTNAE